MPSEPSTNGVDFKSLVLGFSGAALQNLGETTDGKSTAKVVNLPLAHQNIEILALLSEKTKGNLTDEEERILQQVLLDLRMRFIEISRVRK